MQYETSGPGSDLIQDDRGQEWFWLDNAVIDEHAAALGPIGVALYTALARYANNATRQCFPSIPKLAKLFDISEPTVRKYLAKIEERGLMSKVPRKSDRGDATSHLYSLKKVRGVVKHVDHPLNDVSQVVNDVYHRGKAVLPPVVNVVDPKKTKHEEDSVKAGGSASAEADAYVPEWATTPKPATPPTPLQAVPKLPEPKPAPKPEPLPGDNHNRAVWTWNENGNRLFKLLGAIGKDQREPVIECWEIALANGAAVTEEAWQWAIADAEAYCRRERRSLTPKVLALSFTRYWQQAQQSPERREEARPAPAAVKPAADLFTETDRNRWTRRLRDLLTADEPIPQPAETWQRWVHGILVTERGMPEEQAGPIIARLRAEGEAAAERSLANYRRMLERDAAMANRLVEPATTYGVAH